MTLIAYLIFLMILRFVFAFFNFFADNLIDVGFCIFQDKDAGTSFAGKLIGNFACPFNGFK